MYSVQKSKERRDSGVVYKGFNALSARKATEFGVGPKPIATPRQSSCTRRWQGGGLVKNMSLSQRVISHQHSFSAASWRPIQLRATDKTVPTAIASSHYGRGVGGIVEAREDWATITVARHSIYF
jgi:hypothetical protein